MIPKQVLNEYSSLLREYTTKNLPPHTKNLVWQAITAIRNEYPALG